MRTSPRQVGRSSPAWRNVALLLFITLASSAAITRTQPLNSDPRSSQGIAATQPAVPAPAASTQPNAPPSAEPKDFYKLWALAPALVAIVLAIAMRQVIVALFLGVLTAAGMMCCLHGDYNPLHFVTHAMDHYVLGVLAPASSGGAVDRTHITIILYTLFMGAMIGVLGANGATRGVVARITRRVHTRRAGQFAAYVAGLLVFFDDYASAMIVGPGLRPIFDRLRMSREKLAHFVNWTAAPVSSLVISTWLAAQITYLDEGFKAVGAQSPPFLTDVTASSTFWSTIPYRTYPILVLVMAFFVALTGRDFGPLRRAEAAAARNDIKTPVIAGGNEPVNHWLLAALPAGLLIMLTIGLMALTGYRDASAAHAKLSFGSIRDIGGSIQTILGKADSNYALLYASFAAAALAIVLSIASRALSLAKTMDAAVAGMTAMFAACIILVLAWGLSQAEKDLQLGPVANAFLQDKIAKGMFSVSYMPLAVFLTACFISFSTGTAWGTMAILCPPVVSIAAGLLAKMPPAEALPLFYATVGAAMGGAIFGNTCSPLADVAVLSAIFSQCDLAAHVRTVLPYAITVAIVSILCTDGLHFALARWAPQVAGHWNVGFDLLAGSLLLLLILLILGRRPPESSHEPSPPAAV